MKKNITPNKIDLNNFMESAKIIAETCSRFSMADVDYCADEHGNKCPFSQKGYITEEQAIDKLHETGWLQEHDKQMTERPQGEWIPIKMRPGTDEEYEEFSQYGDCPREDFRVFECPLPDDEQEVLVTTRWGDVCVDVWHRDVDCCYFEDNSDDDDVVAWMPLPEPYKKGKWNYIQAGMAVCPFCGASPHKDYKNFCAKCGAEMEIEK